MDRKILKYLFVAAILGGLVALVVFAGTTVNRFSSDCKLKGGTAVKGAGGGLVCVRGLD